MRKRLLIVLLLICIMITPKVIYATDNDTGNAGAMSDFYEQTRAAIESASEITPSTSSSSEDSGSGDNKCKEKTKASYYEGCNYPVSKKIKSTVYMDVYDADGNYLGNALNISDKKFTAGRYVGIDVYELYEITVSVGIEPYCQRVVLSCESGTGKSYCPKYRGCTYTEPTTQNGKIIGGCSCDMEIDYRSGPAYKGSCQDNGYERQTDASCTSCPTKSISEYRDTAEGVIKNEIKKALGDLIDTYDLDKNVDINECMNSNYFDINDESLTSYEAATRNVNDIKDKTTTKIVPYGVICSSNITPTDRNASPISKTLKLKIKYNPQKSCIDGRTGYVRYVKHSEKCSNDELTVNNMYNLDGEAIGKYFIPLNTKTDTAFTYELNSKRKQDETLCLNIIDKYSSENGGDDRWREMIRPEKNTRFENYTTASQAKSTIKQNGYCYYGYEISFNIEQQFYTEADDNKVLLFDGYNSFYRPIDVKNPFPNGLNIKSNWYKLYNSTDNTIKVVDANEKENIIKLNDSFNKVSYIATINNAYKIRKFNSENKYTSWSDMNKNGSSSFINADYGLVRSNNDSFYALGCGPANADWEECKKKYTGAN